VRGGRLGVVALAAALALSLTACGNDSAETSDAGCEEAQEYVEWVDANPVPSESPASEVGQAWAQEFGDVRRAWLDAAPEGIAEAYRASTETDSVVIAEREAAEAAEAKVSAWGRDVCGIDGL